MKHFFFEKLDGIVNAFIPNLQASQTILKLVSF